jgi:broad specificity phosphatase PhoE
LREKEAHTTLLLVRHGIPDYPETRLYAREDDPGLTPEGKRQAARLGDWIKGQGVDALYASPTRRTRETAGPMAEALGQEARLDGRLEERHFGIWEGMDFDVIREKYPEEFTAWKTDPIGFAPQDGETVVDLSRRVEEALGEVRQRHAGRTVLVVTHVGVIRTALCQALQTPLAEYRRFHVATGSVARIDYGRRQANLMYLGVLPGGGDGWKGGDV